ncbi:MAG: hypothetical protein M1814_001685 [Vezdaea aestivalis]|nr:MAG: hypothetical protein M1814_001685 [Vezdaea aestivalis]
MRKTPVQGQTHKENGSIWCCHTSCDLLNAGSLESYLTNVSSWVQTHPYDVVTILLGNSDSVDVTDFVVPIRASGLDTYAYTPPKAPMALDDWPTLSQMILSQKRVVFFMDYKANQTVVPWILDQFSQLWETPFSPQDRSFPCTVQRPPNLSNGDARSRLYMANHNLNTQISIAGANLLVPNTVDINETNGVTGFGSLGVASNSCASDWGRPPNFLLVDFFNNPNNGSVFEVAARANNVTYNRKCCGLVPSKATRLHSAPALLLALTAFFLSRM